MAAQFAAAGFHVYAPLFCSPETDLIVDIHGKLIRIQVKTNSNETPFLRFCTWTTGSVGGYIGAVDWMAFYSPHYGVTAFLRPEEAGCYPTLRYDTEDERLRANSRIRYARDYPMERVIKETLT